MLQNENVVDRVLGHIPSGIASRYATIKILHLALDSVYKKPTKVVD